MYFFFLLLKFSIRESFTISPPFLLWDNLLYTVACTKALSDWINKMLNGQ